MKYLCWLTALLIAAASAGGAATPDPPFTDQYLNEIIRNLYRWEMDETTAMRGHNSSALAVWTRNLDPQLDAGDNSRFREIFFPQFQLDVFLKKADYLIPELGQRVQNKDYMIERVIRTDTPPAEASAYTVRSLKTKEVLDYLKRTRNELAFPDPALMERLRQALRSAKEEFYGQTLTGEQTIYLAPLSPVRNTLWLFWENHGWLIKFSSDSDISNPLFWQMEKLGVRVYDLHENVVVSLDEVQGSHAYVTRDWAARAVFNCVTYGKRMEVTPSVNGVAPATFKAIPHTMAGR